MIKIYGKENCSKCSELKMILENKGLEFEYLQDIKALRVAASKARIMSAPVVEFNDKFFSMEDFLNEVQ